MIRVALIDDHPAVRVGLDALLRVEPGLTPVPLPAPSRVSTADVLAAEPDVVLVDGQLAVGSGLGLCLELSRVPGAPPTVLYSAYVDEELAIAARVAGAAGALNKSESLEQLLDALRVVAGGGDRFTTISPWALRRCAGRLDPDDLPFLSMLAHGTTRSETAETLGVTRDELDARLTRVVARLEACLIPASQASRAAA
jgi:DNA-binding NarL/FixJ family response regulator